MNHQKQKVEALPDGIFAISIPTPFPVGDVNVYLIIDDIGGVYYL